VTGAVTFVFLDIGGVLYDDRVYAEAWRRALREAGGEFTDAAFDEEYAACRAAQNGSFRTRLATRFVGPDADLEALEGVASRYWHYPPSALHDDVVDGLAALRRAGYRLGVIANQPTAVRSALERDGLVGSFEVWGVSDDLGLQKPDPALFVHAVRTAHVEPDATAMVGDRLDYDIRPARAAGMRTVWVLRGEAPDDPTPEQLAEPDATVPDLRGIEAVIGRLGGNMNP
jgi:HAD superfamily hydrolase (TIGR01549 family)